MLIDFPTYINIKCEKCKITTSHRTYSGYPDIPNRPKHDLAECVACGNTFILDDWYKEYVGKIGKIGRSHPSSFYFIK